MWDAATGELVRDWRCHTFGLSALKWAPDGNLLVSSGASGAGFEIQIWDAATGEGVLLYSGHHALVGALAWSPDGTRIVSANRSTAGWILYRQPDPPEAIETMVQVWDSRTGRLLLNYRGHYTGFPISVDAVAWSPDGERIASSSLSTLMWVAPAAPGSGDA